MTALLGGNFKVTETIKWDTTETMSHGLTVNYQSKKEDCQEGVKKKI